MIKYSNLSKTMKLRHLTIIAGISLMGAVVHAKDPVLITPGTANWTSETTATGTRTVFTLTNNTVLNWDQLNLASGSELVFDFVGGKTVVNFLGGTGTHFINGTVTSNGIVAFFSPTADLEVNGSIIAKGVTLATLNADANDFADGNGFELTGTEGFNGLTINGEVRATDGDVVLGGEHMYIEGGARIQASKDLLIGASRNFSVAADGDRRINEKSGEGFVLNLGDNHASRIEISAGKEIYNQGNLNAGNGRVFLKVGTDGQIVHETGGVIVGDAVFEGSALIQGAVLRPDEGDTAPAVGEGTLTIPELTRPDGTKVTTEVGSDGVAPVGMGGDSHVIVPVSTSGGSNGNNGGGSTAGNSGKSTSARTISYSVPMSASGDAGRDDVDTRRSSRQMAKVDNSKSLLKRASFFGLRGGTSSAAVVKR